VNIPIERVLRPQGLAEALRMLGDNPGAVPIAGGTDLMVQLRDGRRAADVLLDLSSVDLIWVREDGDHLIIGAGTSMDRIARSDLARVLCPGLAEAAAQVGAWPIQCRATLGGNLANASPAADTAPPLLAASASVLLVSAGGERTLPVDELFLGPGRSALQPGELIHSVRVPALLAEPGCRVVERFRKVGPRREQVISVVSVALRAHVRAGGEVERIRLAVGSAAPTPVRARRAAPWAPRCDARRQGSCSATSRRSTTCEHRSATAGWPPRSCSTASSESSRMAEEITIRLSLNGEDRIFRVASGRRLLDLLREDAGLMGAKEGCGAGECGACTVLLDGRPVPSCLVLAASCAIDLGGVQCGFCTPGIAVTGAAVLAHGVTEADRQRSLLSGNLCRCTGYTKVFEALEAAQGAGETDDG